MSINVVGTIAGQLLINGEKVAGREQLEVRNPAHPRELVGTIVRGNPNHVDQAVAAAKAAQKGWGNKSFSDRATRLRTALKALNENLDARAQLFVRENGKPIAQATGELSSVPIRQSMALEYASQLDEKRTFKAANGRTYVTGRPYGVVLSIVPWNSPDVLAFTQIVAALLAGNTVVLKPPESCPLTLMRSVEMFAALLAPGLVNVVTGLPNEIGDALTTHPDVAKIGFTGSSLSARRIMSNAAQSIKGVTLELGGNDPAILLDDVNLSDEMLSRLVEACFMMSGQVCMAVKRIYVPATRQTEFLEKFGRAVNSLVIGDGLDPEVTLGPVHTRKAQERAHDLIQDAEKNGAKALSLGTIKDEATFSEGFFVKPTIVTDVPDDTRLMVEEQFCPVIPIAAYDHVEDAIRRANSSPFGLSGSIWGQNIDRAIGIAEQIEAGQVWVNTHGVRATNHLAPYGGVKQSGIGRKSGLEGILEYLQSQAITTFEST